MGEKPHQGDRQTRVLRYETTIERGLYKALHELQRLQAARWRGMGCGGSPWYKQPHERPSVQ